MRVMRHQTLAATVAIAVLAGLFLPSLPGWASKPTHLAEPKQELSSTKLGELRSFGVSDMPAQNFAPSQDDLPQELVEYARVAIQNDHRLHYDSPAQGVLHLSCANQSCARIHAEVTDGVSGPVVWQTDMQYRLNPLIDFTFLPDSKKFANKLINKLAEDYQQTLKATPQKIQIKED